MTRRIVVYATIYGVIGVTIGVLMALYTKDESLKTVTLDKYNIKASASEPEPSPAPVTEEANEND